MKIWSVNFSGLPTVLSSYAPDNGQGIMSAVIKKEGGDFISSDYSTADTFERLAPSNLLTEKINQTLAELNAGEISIPKRKEIHSYLESLKLQIESDEDARRNKFVNEVMLEKFKRERPDATVIKFWSGDGSQGSSLLADEIKRIDKDHPIFAVGPGVVYFKEKLFKYAHSIDALIYSDGELVMPELIKYLRGEKKLADVPGLYLKNGKDITKTRPAWLKSLDDIPDYDYSDELTKAISENEKLGLFVLDDSRRCSNRCAYCIRSSFDKDSHWIGQQPQRFADRLENLVLNQGIKYAKMAGENSHFPYLAKLAQAWIARGINIKFTAYAEASSIDEKNAKILADAGLHAVFLGIESGSDKILRDGLRIKQTVAEVERAVGILKDNGIKVVGSFQIDAPFETEETKEETRKTILRLGLDSVLNQFTFPLPGTQIYNNRKKFNMSWEDDEKFDEDFYRMKIKHMFDKRLWTIPYYLMNGMDVFQLVDKSQEIYRWAKNNGINPYTNDEMFLLSHILKKDAGDFTIETQKNIGGSKSGWVRQTLCDLNKKMIR